MKVSLRVACMHSLTVSVGGRVPRHCVQDAKALYTLCPSHKEFSLLRVGPRLPHPKFFHTEIVPYSSHALPLGGENIQFHFERLGNGEIPVWLSMLCVIFSAR